MGKITKTAGPQRDVTLSPAISEFIKATVSIPLYQLRDHLASFPRAWPFPRGDLYHWIPVLNRFDHILELFNQEYELNSGPQTQPFERRLLLKGDAEDGKASLAAPSQAVLDQLGFSSDGDRELTEQVLAFTWLLLGSCGNRSLYSSSSHLNHLLHTESLSLLKATLRLGFRLAQRYYASRQRMSSVAQQHPALLLNHYNINLDRVQKLASPFARISTSATALATPVASRGKERASLGSSRGTIASKASGNDMISMVKEDKAQESAWEEWAGISLTYYDSVQPSAGSTVKRSIQPPHTNVVPPVTPTPVRRASNLGPQSASRQPRQIAVDESPDGSSRSIAAPEEQPSSSGPKVLEVSPEEVSTTPTHELLKSKLPEVPDDLKYDLLHKIRVAKAFGSDRSSREDLVAVRLLAVANLAYVLPDATFQQKVAQQDSDEPRRFQLPCQLCELVQSGVSQDLQNVALYALEALCRQKSKGTDVFNALSANVNHGVLFYVIRKFVAQLAVDDSPIVDCDEDESREALFAVLYNLPTVTPRAGETMISAGLFEVLVEALTIRTNKAERNHTRTLQFIDQFVYNIRDGFQSFVNAKGLDVIADLTAYEAKTSFELAEQGKGMPDQYKTQLTDYRIPFHQQGTLRALFKFLNHMLQHSGTNHDRLLRNLIDSPQLLGALRIIIGNAPIFGSSVWSNAVNMLSNFIHNEPTSYAAIAEAGLSKGFLEAVVQLSFPDPETPAPSEPVTRPPDAGPMDIMTQDPASGSRDLLPQLHAPEELALDPPRIPPVPALEPREKPPARGILPAPEAVSAIPQAFGAICLNEAGMRLFQASGALESFFEIFESPEHVKALDADVDVSTMLGNSFDELVRHHPPLKSAILKAVRDMVIRVVHLCYQRAVSQGVGAKLWLNGDDGQIVVAGGREALTGPEGPFRKRLRLSADLDSDVEMEDADSAQAPTRGMKGEVPIAQVVETEDPKHSPTVTQYITLVCRFLTGFFSNTSLCSAFIGIGGLEWVMDLATLPCLPYNFQETMGMVDELSRVIQQLVEQKPYVALPSAIKRLQAATDQLQPLLDHDKPTPFFSVFTKPSSSLEGQEPVDGSTLEGGTTYAKALVTVHTLCNALSTTFQAQMFNHRSSSNIFTQVNLADMYCRLVASLGKLHRSCIWEEILLLKGMPASWKNFTRVTSEGFGVVDADNAMGISHSDTTAELSTDATESNATKGDTDASADGDTPQAISEQSQQTAQFKNTRTLRYLLSQVPPAISPFFQSLGRILLFRRSIDVYQKQKAFMVANELAAAAINQLRFAVPRTAASAHDRYSYWIVVLTSISQLMIDETMDRTFPQTLTLIIKCFKEQGGFEALNDILEIFFDEAKSIIATNQDEEPQSEAGGLLNLALGGMKMILTLYSKIITGKFVTEATQTVALHSRPDRDLDRWDYFTAANFIVELRVAVVRPVQKIWNSDLMDKATTSIVKTIIDIFKTVLEGDMENGAVKSSDNVPQRGKMIPKSWRPRNEQQLELMSKKYGGKLALEALYRCHDSHAMAADYCEMHMKDPRLTGNPIPEGEAQVESGSQGSPSRSQSNTAPGNTLPNASAVPLPPIGDFGPPLVAQDAPGETYEQAARSRISTSPDPNDPWSDLLGNDILHGALGASWTGPSESKSNDAKKASEMPGVVTVEDLEDERSNLRKNLIDRSLDVLNVHEEVTFDLSDLVTAAVLKAPDPAAMRAEIGSTLLQSLISLQTEDDFRVHGKKIAAYAQLLALVLQDKQFFEATFDELKESFAPLVGFIKIFPDQKPEESPTWIGHVLLITERLLAEDAQPHQIQWTLPSDDNAVNDTSVADLPEPLIHQEEKSQLFGAILEILPRIGKDESLALSITRVLVILSRNRELAVRLGERHNIQRLFIMIKQLSGITNEKLQGSILIVLRHVVEDEETIRQIMRTEIQTMFENRQTRHPDTTAYIRQMYHLALRHPSLFVETTNEKLTVAHFEGGRGPQTLALRKDEKSASTDSAGSGEGGAGDDAQSAESTNGHGARLSTEASEAMELSEKNKITEMKPPVVQNPDGIIHFLLHELLAYKDVQDQDQPAIKPANNEAAKAPESTDAEMLNGDSDPFPGSTSAASEQKKTDKPEFKAEHHPIYIYRCFLLQCLTELLSSYNRTKVEFINFSRKADPQAATPSKPRSGVLNYLLSALIPIGTLNHVEDIPSRKRHQTSGWATSVVVALCAKTGENGPDKGREGSETDIEPELAFVRRFVLEHALKAFKEAQASTEPLDTKYSRLLSFADLFNRMLTAKPSSATTTTTNNNNNDGSELGSNSARQLARMMYEKNYISALTTSIAEVDLNFPGAKRAVKYILRPLRLLTETAINLSLTADLTSTPGLTTDDDEISTESSVSDMDDEREETPDLYRNSALGMLETGRGDASESDSDEDDDDEDMYEDEYGEEMDYDEDMPHEHNNDDDVVSEDDEDLEGMGPIEGLSGDVPMDVEVVIDGEDDDLTDDEDDEDEEDDDDDDDIEILEEVTGDDENISLGEGGEEEWGTEEEEEDEDGEEYPSQGEIEDDQGPPHGGGLDIVRVLGEDPQHLLERLEGGDTDIEREIEREILEGEDEDEEEEEDYDEEDVVYEPDFEDDEDGAIPNPAWGWGNDLQPVNPTLRGHHHHHHHHRGGPWTLFGGRGDDRILGVVPSYRAHRPGGAPRGHDDGTNPLLQRPGRSAGGPAAGGRGEAMSDWVHAFDAGRPGRVMSTGGDGPVSFINNLINVMAHGGPGIHRHGNALHLTINGPSFESFPGLEAAFRLPRPPQQPSPRASRDDPAQAVSFTPALTMSRWQEEARLLFGTGAFEKSQRVINSLCRLMVPPAIEAYKRRIEEERERQRKAKEELEVARAKEAAEKAEREAQEKKEREELEEAEREAAEAAAATTARALADEVRQTDRAATETQSMEGVETTQPLATNTPADAGASQPAERVTVTIRGRELDITGMGIDLEYLEALPEEFREEVLMQQLTEQRSQAAAGGDEADTISREFLDALPPELREEVLQSEAQERRRREREEARRRAAASGAPAVVRADDIDTASFLRTLDPALRQTVLMEQDEEILAQLPRDIAAEARAYGGDRRLNQLIDMPRMNRARGIDRAEEPEEQAQKKAKPRPIVQMLDKAGVATLLRLMFIPLQGSSQKSLHGILRDVCANRQNRAEVVSILLTILQDCSGDLSAVERSFAQLSLRAKQPPSQSTPKPLKRTLTGQMPIGNDMSPLMVVQQCLSTLEFLTSYNHAIAMFFLVEHETAVGSKYRTSRKGKSKENKAARYPLNALLGLLDRRLVVENSSAMEQMAHLLNLITQPLGMLPKKDKDDPSNKRTTEEAAEGSRTAEQAETAQEGAAVDTLMTSAAEEPTQPTSATATEAAAAVQSTPTAAAEGEESKEQEGDKTRRPRILEPPEVPEYNLRLLVNIIAARECTSKTFRDTISVVTHMSGIPGAKETFGQELVKQAQELGKSILSDLAELITQISKAKTETDVQGMALARFLPASSDQMKLLRVFTALDFLTGSSSGTGPMADRKPTGADKELLDTLYKSPTFGQLWSQLSACLTAIRQRGNMFNVATILLPLIEVLMIVCKNMPKSGTENLFFAFTEEHRKILNDLVRHNPKLMSGSFALLVQNSKVLEFDNKRNYFSRKLHHRGSTDVRHTYPPLQLSIRRSEVFLDSYKSLYFKSGDEVKYGKLSIRFHGEEGVDAGGVTREWFQVLAKQMFNPDYALFNPVASDRTTFHPNPHSAINPEHLSFFKFIGRIIGKALYEGRVLDCHFSRAVYKRILSKNVGMKDMESIDLDYYKSLAWMLENDITDVLTETFSIETEAFGEKIIVDLIENGRNIPVTEENKHEFVQLVVNYRMIGSVNEQLEKFLEGFHDIVPADLISIFNEQELELLISGLPDIDVDDWKNNTEYQTYTAASPQIQWFWRAVRSFDKEERAKLLQFVTGTSKVPLNGFKELEGMNGFSRFNIHKDFGSKDRLPSSHTCFNQLDLPAYDDYESLRKALYTAMTAGSEYFGFA